MENYRKSFIRNNRVKKFLANSISLISPTFVNRAIDRKGPF